MPILANRSRKQQEQQFLARTLDLEINKNSFHLNDTLDQNVVLSDLCNLSELSLEQEENTSCEDSISSSQFSNSTTSCDSLALLSTDSNGSSFSSQSYDLESRKKTSNDTI